MDTRGRIRDTEKELKVLVLSELFPNPVRPASGIFVERQVSHLRPFCNQTVVAPVRVFPHLRLWKHLLRPKRFVSEWRQWQTQLDAIPLQGQVNEIPVFYPRYTSPPRQGFRGLWGHFAYPFVRRLLQTLYQKQPFDLIHAHTASPCGSIALLAQRWMRVPVVLTIHGADVHYTAKQNWFNERTVRWVLRNVDAIMANSTWTFDQIVSYGGHSGKVQIVRLGGDAPQEVKPRSQPAPDGAVSLLSVGHLRELKGHAYVLKALKVLVSQGYNVHYTIVGDGDQREKLQSLADELNLANIVSFEGAKAHNEVWPYFAACDIFVLPSRVEGFGVVFIEALGLGKPVIGCAGTGGPEDLRTLGDCIELAQPRDVESLVQALKRLLDDPERRQRMGELGRKIVAKHFTWERNAADTLAIYRRVLKWS